MSKSYKIMLSGGGTGGHIFPAVSIANELKLRYPDAEFLFVGAKDRMEMEKIPLAGYNIEGLWISGIQRSLSLSNLSFPFKLISSLWKSRSLIRKFKPDVVIGTGGFASGALLYVASKRGIPCLIQEQNSFPGITNKLLGNSVEKICVAFEGLEKFFPREKIILTGNPIRQDLLNKSKDSIDVHSEFGFDKSKKTILVLGGSLGARAINRVVASKLDWILEQGYQLLWQTGKLYIDEYGPIQKEKDNAGLKIEAFLNDMNKAYSVADLIISRSGASSISEMCVVKKPVIFIPSPNVAEDHQTKNAKALSDKGAAVLLKESKSEDMLVDEISAILENEARAKELSTNIEKLALPNASSDIVDEIEKLLKK